tara:strand:+ start:2967 stop:3224 length:258 start_codon:yes stop_codon:yes gene_type:complete
MNKFNAAISVIMYSLLFGGSTYYTYDDWSLFLEAQSMETYKCFKIIFASLIQSYLTLRLLNAICDYSNVSKPPIKRGYYDKKRRK